MKKILAIIGASPFGHLVEDLALEIGEFQQVVFFDDTKEKDAEKILGNLSDIETCYQQKQFTHLALAIGYKHFDFRHKIYQRFLGEIPFATLLHPTVYIHQTAQIAEGVIAFSQSNFDRGSIVGPNVVIFNQTSITHDVKIGANSFLSVGVNLGGGVTVGERSFIGVGATIVHDIEIGDDCIVCAGTLLTRDIEDNTCVIGNPFRKIDRIELK